MSTGALLKILRHPDYCSGYTPYSYTAVRFSQDAKSIVVDSYEEITIWDFTTETAVESLLSEDWEVLNADPAISPDGQVKLTKVGDSSLLLTHTETGNSVAIAAADDESSFVIGPTAFGVDKEIISFGDNIGTIRVYDAQTGKLLRQLLGHTDRVVSLACSLAGSLLVSGADDGYAKIWNVETGALLQNMKIGEETVSRVAFSPDSKSIVACAEKTIKTFDVATGMQTSTRTVPDPVKDAAEGAEEEEEDEDGYVDDWWWLSLGFSPDGCSVIASHSGGVGSYKYPYLAW